MSDRILRIDKLVKKELSQIIFREIDFPDGVLVTLTRVETMPNLIEAKIYISVMPEDYSGKVLDILNQQIYFLQQRLNKRLKMRPIPRIHFIEERATREAGRVEELIVKIHKQNK